MGDTGHNKKAAVPEIRYDKKSNEVKLSPRQRRLFRAHSIIIMMVGSNVMITRRGGGWPKDGKGALAN